MNIQLSLETREVNLVLAALGKLPLEQSLDLFLNLRGQVESQLATRTNAEQNAAPWDRAASSSDSYQPPPKTKKPA